MASHNVDIIEEESVEIQQIVNKLDSYRDVASNYGVEINARNLHTTHGILYSTFDYKTTKIINLNELLGTDFEVEKQSFKNFYEEINKNILNVDHVKEELNDLTHNFFNREINQFRLKNILYKRKNELLYLDVSFSKILDDSFIVFVDDVTDYVKDKLLLEEFAIHNNILVKEVHHRVKNNLQILLSLISLQQRFGYDEATISDYMKLSVSSMALIHNQLYSDNLDYVSVDNIIVDFENNIKNYYGDCGVDFIFESKSNINITIDQSSPLFLILNELIINSINHAFDEDDSKKLIKCFLEKQDDNLHIIYTDNGRGLKDIDEKESGLGRVLIESLMGQIDGTYEVTSENGYKMDIEIPVQQKKER